MSLVKIECCELEIAYFIYQTILDGRFFAIHFNHLVPVSKRSFCYIRNIEVIFVWNILHKESWRLKNCHCMKLFHKFCMCNLKFYLTAKRCVVGPRHWLVWHPSFWHILCSIRVRLGHCSLSTTITVTYLHFDCSEYYIHWACGCD